MGQRKQPTPPPTNGAKPPPPPAPPRPVKPVPPRNLVLGEGQQPPRPTFPPNRVIRDGEFIGYQNPVPDWADRERAWLKQNRREIHTWLFAALGWGLLAAVLFLEAAGVL